MRTSRRFLTFLVAVAAGLPAAAQALEVSAPSYAPGAEWTTLELEGANVPVPDGAWQRATFWDLRPRDEGGVTLRWEVLPAHEAGIGPVAGADLALCASERPGGRRVGCRLVESSSIGPAGPRALLSTFEGESASWRRVETALGPEARLTSGVRYVDRWLDGNRVAASVEGRAIAEGIALTPSGPAQVLLLRETTSGADGERVVFRFVAENGRTVARLETAPGGEPGLPVRASLLAEADRLADDGIEIPYTRLSEALVAGTTGFLQYSYSATGANCFVDADCPAGICIGANAGANEPGSCHLDLGLMRAGWNTIADAIGIDQTSVPYQPDPADPSTQVTLPEVWDFSTLDQAYLQQRTFNTTRDDTGWSGCLESCAVKNVTAAPPDGSWQSYLKIDNYDESGVFVTRDIFELNDNDTGADPSIDVPYVVQDQSNASDRTQICFDDSGGNAADRLLRFFQFTGPDTASAVVGVGDTWTSGNWTSCNDASGLHLTIASTCGDACYPGCPDSAAAPRARGLFANGGGLRSTIWEDGYIHVAAGNYVPALLLLQETDIQAGADLFGTCNISAIRNRGMDWFWLHEKYGLLALISGPNDDGTNACGLIQPTDWSCFGERTDGADFTWGPFPPYQISSQACLNGTRVAWALPEDGSNLTGEPNVSDWGYVVSWGSDPDPEALADWATNPNHTPLPGAGGYLAATPGSEPTSYVIPGGGMAARNATVVTALQYTDPDAGDTTPYRSAAFFKVTEDPAVLDPAVFRVGDGVAPFVSKSGNDLTLSWPAVAGASSYVLVVYDLATESTIPCPAGLDCAPATNSAVFSGAAVDGVAYGFRALAVDACGDPSAD